MIKIRQATKQDRQEILAFCADTFSWGDYIDQVWDYWLEDKAGRLLIAESSGRKVAVSHAKLCPGKKLVWLEGIRVHPTYRRSRLATNLIESMIEYGRKEGATRASAIVGNENRASQRMMEKTGFKAVSRWVYYGTRTGMNEQKSKATISENTDSEKIWHYLQSSKIYSLSARTYEESWHWYPLDRRALHDLVREKRVLMTGVPVDGVAVINQTGYWQKRNIVQIVYLDSKSPSSLRDLLSYAVNIYVKDRYERLQVLCQEDKTMMSAISEYPMEESEQFLLYDKVFTTSHMP